MTCSEFRYQNTKAAWTVKYRHSRFKPSHSALSYPHMVSPINAMRMTLNYFSLYPFWHPGGNTNLCLPGRYLSLDVGPLPQAQPRQYWAALPPGEGMPTQKPLHHGWQLHSVALPEYKEPWRDPGQHPVVLYKHQRSDSLLQVHGSTTSVEYDPILLEKRCYLEPKKVLWLSP